jgi:hypothetical protein
MLPKKHLCGNEKRKKRKRNQEFIKSQQGAINKFIIRNNDVNDNDESNRRNESNTTENETNLTNDRNNVPNNAPINIPNDMPNDVPIDLPNNNSPNLSNIVVDDDVDQINCNDHIIYDE